MRLVQATRPSIRAHRYFTTTISQRLQEPDPNAIPAVGDIPATEDQASMVVAETKASKEIGRYRPEHQPDYSAHVDEATGVYSPIPKRVQDGSEPGETLAAAILSGAPVDLQARTVR